MDEIESERSDEGMEKEKQKDGKLKDEDSTIRTPTLEESLSDPRVQRIVNQKKKLGKNIFPTIDLIKEQGTKSRTPDISGEDLKKMKAHYRDIPSIDEITADEIDGISEKTLMLEKEYKLFTALSIELEDTRRLHAIGMITEQELITYMHTQKRLRETIEHKINQEGYDWKENAGLSAGIGLAVGGLFFAGLGVMGLPLAIPLGAGVGVAVLTGAIIYGDLYSEDNTKEKDSRDLNEEYSNFLQALDPIKEAIYKKRHPDAEKRPKAAQRADVIADQLKYKVDQLYKLAST